MANPRFFRQAFTGGEISPEMFGHIDDIGFQTGLAKCRNFQVRPQGSVENRAGFEFIAKSKTPISGSVRLIPFIFSSTQSVIIEMGEKYARFYTKGALILKEDGQSPYEIALPYLGKDIFDVKYTQSLDVITLTHKDYEPLELKRYGGTDWRISPVPINKRPDTPSDFQITNKPVNPNEDNNDSSRSYHEYVVTAVDKNGAESLPTEPQVVFANLYRSGNRVRLHWSANDASYYKVYKLSTGVFGYLGRTNTSEFYDDNITPDTSITPPIYDDIFLSKGIKSVEIESGGKNLVGSAGAIKSVETIVNKKRGFLTQEKNSLSAEISDKHGSGAELRLVFKSHGRNYGPLAVYTIERIDVVKGGRGYVNPRVVLKINGNEIDDYKGYSFIVTTRKNEINHKIIIKDDTGFGAKLEPIFQDGSLKEIRVLGAGHDYTDPKIILRGNGYDTEHPEKTAPGVELPVIKKVNLIDTEYPSCSAYYQQRRIFAGSASNPQTVWMTKTGTESNMSYSIPLRADDRIKFKLAAREASIIRHIVTLNNIILLTESSEWTVNTLGTDILKPDSVSVSMTSSVGSSKVQPLVINNNLIYGASIGGHLREYGYNWQAGGYIGRDLCLRANHLFDGFNLVDLANAKSPYPVIWAVSESGNLLGCTYIPEQNISAWHAHETKGIFRSCAVVPEDGKDVLYVIVDRFFSGGYKSIERLSHREYENGIFADSALVYDSPDKKVTKVSGLDHLEGQPVSVVADGSVVDKKVVKNGSVSIGFPASRVVVGLPIDAYIHTLPVVLQTDGAWGQGRVKNINRIYLRVLSTRGVFASQGEQKMVEYKSRTVQSYGEPPENKTGQIEIDILPEWSNDGQLYIRQPYPLPLTIVSLAAEVAIGG